MYLPIRVFPFEKEKSTRHKDWFDPVIVCKYVCAVKTNRQTIDCFCTVSLPGHGYKYLSLQSVFVFELVLKTSCAAGYTSTAPNMQESFYASANLKLKKPK